MIRPSPNVSDSITVALQALAVSLGDESRASRLLSLTGLTPDDLRHRASEPAVLVAVLRFLEDHEPDLLAVADTLGVRVDRRPSDRAPFHPGRCVELTLADGTPVGWAGELHPQVVQRLGLPARTGAAELDLDVLISASDHRTQVAPLSTHPMASSDVALVVTRDVRFGDVEESLRAGAGELLESVELFDVYVGDQLGADQQSLAFRMHFRAPDRTLTTQEVNAARDAAVKKAVNCAGSASRAW